MTTKLQRVSIVDGTDSDTNGGTAANVDANTNTNTSTATNTITNHAETSTSTTDRNNTASCAPCLRAFVSSVVFFFLFTF